MNAPEEARKRDAPAFDFYPERWTHGTRHMSKTEKSDYLELLCHQWTEDGLPQDLEIVARVIGYKKAAQIPPLVLEKFPLSSDGKRRNLRLEKEREAQRGRIEKRREGAKKTNAKRWGSDSLGDRSATRERQLSDNDSDSPPPTTHHPPKNPSDSPRRSATVVAESVYAEYPRKIGKPPALKAIEKALRSPPEGVSLEDWPDMLRDITARYAQHRKGEDQTYTPHPATWFNEARYNDDPSTWKSRQPHGKPHQPNHPASNFEVFRDAPEREKTSHISGRLF